jgi:hypothetical protein
MGEEYCGKLWLDVSRNELEPSQKVLLFIFIYFSFCCNSLNRTQDFKNKKWQYTIYDLLNHK